MTNPFYCKLYIDTSEELSNVQSRLDGLVKIEFPSFSVEAVTFRNENYIQTTNLSSEFYPIERSRYYVELDVESVDDSELDAFQCGVARVVKVLREGGWFVVASCDFEEVISAETGWNWSRENPMQPVQQ